MDGEAPIGRRRSAMQTGGEQCPRLVRWRRSQSKPGPSAARRGPLWLAPLALACALAAPSPAHAEFKPTSGSVTMISEGGDWVGGGTDRLYDAAETLSISGGLGGVEVSVSSGSEWFHLRFEPASGKQLEVGEYEGAERFAGAGTPGLDIGGDGRGCNEDLGRFIVKDIHV